MNWQQLIVFQKKFFETSDIPEIPQTYDEDEKPDTGDKSTNDSLELDITQPGRDFNDKEILDKNADA